MRLKDSLQSSWPCLAHECPVRAGPVALRVVPNLYNRHGRAKSRPPTSSCKTIAEVSPIGFGRKDDCPTRASCSARAGSFERGKPRQRVVHAERCLATSTWVAGTSPGHDAEKKHTAYDDVEAGQSRGTTTMFAIVWGFPCLGPREGRKNLDEEPTSLFVCSSEPDSRGPSTAMT